MSFDEDQPNTNNRDPLEVSIGLIIRVRANKIKKILNELAQHVWAKMDINGLKMSKEQDLIQLIQVQEGFNPYAT